MSAAEIRTTEPDLILQEEAANRLARKGYEFQGWVWADPYWVTKGCESASMFGFPGGFIDYRRVEPDGTIVDANGDPANQGGIN